MIRERWENERTRELQIGLRKKMDEKTSAKVANFVYILEYLSKMKNQQWKIIRRHHHQRLMMPTSGKLIRNQDIHRFESRNGEKRIN